MVKREESLDQLKKLHFRAHPWHGITIGEEAPKVVNSFIEMVTTDTVKYEMDKETGYLKINRPQKFSNICPTLYGLIPQTLCSQRVAEYSIPKTGRRSDEIAGDEDPMDICILTEKTISHGDIVLRAIPIGGLRMIDQGKADDKIIAVMQGDALYGEWKDIDDCPTSFIDRLKHYFLTYKDLPDSKKRICEITGVYGKSEAYEIIERSHEDYNRVFNGKTLP